MSSAVARAARRDAGAARRLLGAPACRSRTPSEGAHPAASTVRGFFGVASPFEGRMFLSPPLLNNDFVSAVISMLLRTVQEEATRPDRFVSSVCGLAVGMSLVCLTVSADANCWEWPQAQEARLARSRADSVGAAARAASPPVLDMLANRLVRKNSKLIHEAYTFSTGPPLGAGAFGVVLRAVHNGTGIERAVKRIDKGAAHDAPWLLREVEALRVMDHPHIYRLMEYFETSRHLWLVTELCHGEELCNRLLNMPGGMAEADAARLMRQMLLATLHCHRRSVVHGDLKPENFLVTRGKAGDMLKLIDFGLAVPLESSGRSSGPPVHAPADAGTLLYMSPQMLNGESTSWADDVWSLGVIFHILLTGRFPFSTNDDARFQELCIDGLLERDVQDHLGALQNSPVACDLAASLLAVDPAQRITVEEALRHPFLRGSALAAPAERPAPELRERCERFARTCRLRRLALAVSARLADGSWPDAERVQAAFLSLDSADGSAGAIDSGVLFGSDGLRGVAPWLARWLYGPEAVATSSGQAMTYTSFAAAHFSDAVVSGGERLSHAVFELLDADQDGVLSAEDLRRRLDLTLKESVEMIREALGDIGVSPHRRSGLGLQEFVHLMRPRDAPRRE